MKQLLVSFFIFLVIIYACNKKSAPNTSTTNFTLLDASLQNWIAGTPEGGSGTEYYFKLNINTSKKIIFDSVWINNESFKMLVTKKVSHISNEEITYTKGDTITLRISNLQNQKKTETPPPIIYNGAALFSYKVGNKVDFFTIKEVKTIDTANRP